MCWLNQEENSTFLLMKSPHSPGEIALQAAQGVAEDGADATRKRHGGNEQKAYSRVVYKRQ